jgi:hypothetical protein
MSEYYLADLWAEERAKQRELQTKPPSTPTKSQDIKVTLLGDFMFPTTEPQGCDPYNSVQGKTSREVWSNTRSRR